MSLLNIEMLEKIEVDCLYKKLYNKNQYIIADRLKLLASEYDDESLLFNKSILGFSDFINRIAKYDYNLQLTSDRGQLCLDMSNDSSRIIIFFENRTSARVVVFDKDNQISKLSNIKKCNTVYEITEILIENNFFERKYDIPKTLFDNGELSLFLSNQKQQIFDSLHELLSSEPPANINPSQFYQYNEQIPIMCFEHEISVNSECNVIPHYKRFEPLTILGLSHESIGTTIRYSVPFAGTEDLLLHRPKQSYVLPYSGEIENNKIHVTYHVPSNFSDRIDDVNHLFSDHWHYIKNMIGWINDEVKEHNVSIKNRIDLLFNNIDNVQ